MANDLGLVVSTDDHFAEADFDVAQPGTHGQDLEL
jgi:hypothetical protein